MALNQNQFAQIPVLGMLDQSFNTDSVSCVLNSGTVVPGQSVKLVDSAGGVPKVAPVTSDSDIVFGFVNYNIKNASFSAGAALEVSLLNNVIYLQATEAFDRGAKLKGVVATVGGVAAAVQGEGSPIIGWAFDKAVNVGDLVRVFLACPSYFLS